MFLIVIACGNPQCGSRRRQHRLRRV